MACLMKPYDKQLLLSFPRKKNHTRALRMFCNVSLVASSIFKEKYVSWRLDISFSSIHRANPNLILYDAVDLDNRVRFKALQSFDNSFAISIISPARANENSFQHNMTDIRLLDLALYPLLI